MIRAIRVHPAQTWPGDAQDTVVLDFSDRYRRRMAMTGVRGLSFLLDLPEAVMLRGGDGLELEDGRMVEVIAAPEPLVEIRASAPRDLLRLAWHIGNRHLPAQLMANAIRIRQDHVIEEMLRGLGARLVAIEGPFDPEGGAYAQGGHKLDVAASSQAEPHHHESAPAHDHRHGQHGHAHHDGHGHGNSHAHDH